MSTRQKIMIAVFGFALLFSLNTVVCTTEKEKQSEEFAPTGAVTAVDTTNNTLSLTSEGIDYTFVVTDKTKITTSKGEKTITLTEIKVGDSVKAICGGNISGTSEQVGQAGGTGAPIYSISSVHCDAVNILLNPPVKP